ncbi:hypothetical protein [Desulfobacter latus]|uniref:Uncharacterized protein n=1 Tax=Desulfobacter latus TaxID=2292 RepID=A0A850T7G1_9BACT|nr:hypothetical protein [Desulfobacter latus]NWH04995.1 hypothetical protein [Desulfobacter latus]
MKRILLIGLLPLITIGCLPVPKRIIPNTPKPGLYDSRTDSTAWLDCLSNELGTINFKKEIRLVIAEVRNEFRTDVSEILLPTRLNAFVENALARITNVYTVYEFQNQGTTHITPDYIIAGGLYNGQENKAIVSRAELVNLGIEGRVKAYDLSMYLKAIDAETKRKVVMKSLTVRLYSGEQGGDAMLVIGGDNKFITGGRLTGTRAAGVTTAIQALSDYLVASLIRELSTTALGLSFSACDREIDGLDKSRIPNQSKLSSTQQPIHFRLVKNSAGLVCTEANVFENFNLTQNDRLLFRWRQYSSSISFSVPLGHDLYDSVNASSLKRRRVCLPAEKIFNHTRAIELEIYHEKSKNILGVGAL